jgi:hypothetical protein
MTHMAKDMRMSTKHVCGVQRVEDVPDGRDGVIGLTAEAKTGGAAMGEEDINRLALQGEHGGDIRLAKEAAGLGVNGVPLGSRGIEGVVGPV